MKYFAVFFIGSLLLTAAVFPVSASSHIAAPTNLSASYAVVSGYGLVYLYWTDNASNETEFQVFRKLSTDSSWPSARTFSVGAKTATAPSTVQTNDPTANLPSGTYEYMVAACDSSGCSGFSNTYSVVVGTSSSGTDTTAPSTPSGFTVNATSLARADLSWGTSTDNVGVSGYKIYRNGAYFTTVSASTASYADTAVSGGMTYRYYVVAYDAAGNVSSPTAELSVTVLADSTAPTAPGNLTVSTPSSTSVYLSWNASNDNVGVAQYALYRNNAYLNYTTSLSYTDTSVTAGGTYTYYVTAYDGMGNLSSASNSVTVTLAGSSSTTNSGDTTAPTAPSSVSTLVVSSSSISVSWSGATDNVGVSGYKIYRNGFFLTTTTMLSYSDANLSPSTAYSYAIAAYDAAGNSGPQSVSVSVTTWSGTTTTSTTTTSDFTAPVITSVRAENIMGSGAQIKWNTDDAADSRVPYGTAPGNYALFSDNRCDGGGMVTAHCVNLTGLVAGTTYYYKAESRNAANLDTHSGEYSFTAASSVPAGDSTAPTAPSAISSYAISSSSVSVSWSGATDNVGVSGYKIYRNGTYITSTAALSYQDTGLSASVSYSYAVAAYDAAGNNGPQSASTSVTTMSTTTTTIVYAGISGTVTDPAGASVSGANVYATSGSRYYSAITDNTGKYSIASAYPDTYQMKAYPPAGASYQSVSISVSLTAGQTTVADLKFSASLKTVKGKITYAGGKPVTSVGVGAYNSAAGLWTNGTVDANGAYALKVSGGKWQVNIYPSSTVTGQMNNWSYAEAPRDVIFKDDNSTEEAVVDFTVNSAQVSVSGYVLLPDGSAPASGTVNISLKGSSGYEYRPSVDAAGYFFMYLSSDTYVGQIFSTAAQYGSASIAAFSVAQDSVYLGKLYLKTNADRIHGTVKDQSGRGIAGVWVNANQYTGGMFVQTKSSADGSYDLTVAAGDWSVQAYADSSTGYSYNQAPKFVTVFSGTPAEAHFTLTASDAQIVGSIIDASGQTVADAQGYVSTYIPTNNTGMMGYAAPSFGGSIEKGVFSFKVPAGSYALTVYFSSDSAYTPPAPYALTVATGETKKVNITIAQNDVTISGRLKDDGGNVITGVGDDKVKVYLSAQGGAWHNVKIDAATGSFSANVAAGTWYLGYWADSAAGYVSSGKDTELVVVPGEHRTADVALLKANSVITGTAKTETGTPLANVWVSVDTRSFATSADTVSSGMMTGSSYVAGGSSDGSGNFTVKVPAGKYFVHSYYPMTTGYTNPAEVAVTVVAGQTATADLVFRKPDVALSGTTTIDGKAVAAFVWAWGETGGYASGRSDASGKYSLSVSRNMKWHVASSLESAGAYYKSADIAVAVGDVPAVTQDMVLLPVTAQMPSTMERVVETVKPQSVELSNGAKVVLPANSLATGGSASVVMKPEVEAPSIGSSSVVGTGYTVEAKDEKGQGITNLNSEITVSIPYDEDELAARGIGPENLTLSFYDETAGVWKALEKQVVDKQNKTVSAVVSHLTLFALVAPADTTPPQAPGNPAVSMNGGTVTLSWTNPVADFHHAKIYRSSQEGTLGEVAFNYLTGTSQTDVAPGPVAYYVIRAVDLAGNESANIMQYQAREGVVSGTASPAVRQPVTAAGKALLIRVAGDPRVYVVTNNMKRHIPSIAAFTASGFSWGDVKTVSAREVAAYATGNVVKAIDNPRVYVVANGAKTWIKTAEEFAAAGYRWNMIAEISAAELAAYPDAAALPAQLARDMKLGARGNDVRLLQQTLAKDTTVYPEGMVTGYYGKLTTAAVRKFQEKYGIAETSGVAGPKTREKINQLLQ